MNRDDNDPGGSLAVPSAMAHGKVAALLHLPPRVLFDVNEELACYLLPELARCWPQVRILRRLPDRLAVAELCVVDREPGLTPIPTLWLAEIDGTRALRELAPGLWRTGMPTTATQLRQQLQECLRRLPQHRRLIDKQR
ncbi:MAG: hypothetical protein KDI60_09220 [Xanthomonadales bacterium]|nr:hypothetical protein [Xanthomonadales bacterium]MCB1611919.1 hypothetical protein [Xanthomonadales bacterium]MCP5473236.1 hypothetical protein [Rhodanobacteraceae bacterium]